MGSVNDVNYCRVMPVHHRTETGAANAQRAHHKQLACATQTQAPLLGCDSRWFQLRLIQTEMTGPLEYELMGVYYTLYVVQYRMLHVLKNVFCLLFNI